eukprot:465146-Pyramimonas_sp.AAC.1
MASSGLCNSPRDSASTGFELVMRIARGPLGSIPGFPGHDFLRMPESSLWFCQIHVSVRIA